jgi:hypothetical protein
MIVHDLDVFRIAVAPNETDPEPIVDPNTVLPLAVAPEAFQAVAGRRPQIVQRPCRVQHGQFSQRSPFYRRERPNLLSRKEISGPPVAKRPNRHFCM